MLTSSKIWLSMIDRTHSVGLLRGSTGLNAIKEWADTATTKQRSALSQLLLSLADHMTPRLRAQRHGDAQAKKGGQGRQLAQADGGAVRSEWRWWMYRSVNCFNCEESLSARYDADREVSL